MIEIKVNGQIVSVQETETLYSGTADVQHCRFRFDKNWNGFEKSAVFRVGAEAHTKLLDENGGCILPWELLTQRNVGRELEVGVYGVSTDTEIVTSVWDSLGVIREGSWPGNDAKNPVDGVYEQVMAKLRQIRDAVGIHDDAVLALAQRAETAARLSGESAEMAMKELEEVRALLDEYGGIPGKDGYTPVKGVDYFDGKDGKSGIYIGSDAPPEWAKVWIDPNENPTNTETWEFSLEDGTTAAKTVVIIG